MVMHAKGWGSLPALRSGDRSLDAALVLSVLLFVVGAVTAVGQFVWSELIRRNNGCGFDGTFYCAMLKGEVVPTPFSRRILVPFLAKQFDTNGLAGFWVVNVLSLVGVTLIAMYIAWRLRPVAGVHSRLAYRFIPPLLVGAAFLSARNNFHLIATYPALTDPLALLLLVSSVGLVVAAELPSTRLLLIPVCFLAPLAREELAGVLVLALVLAVAMRFLPWLVALVASAASVAGGLFALSRPDVGPGTCIKPEDLSSVVPCPDSISGTIRFWVDADFSTWGGFFRFGVMLMLALGPFVFLLGRLHTNVGSRRPAAYIVGVAGIFAAISVLGGGDTDRILAPAGLLLALGLLTTDSARATALMGLCLVVAAYVVQQDPLHAVGGDQTAWLAFFGLRITTLRSVVNNGLVPTLIALPLGVAGLLLLRSKGFARSSLEVPGP